MAEWQAGGILNCFGDIPVCCYGYCCGACMHGQNVEIIDGTSCIMTTALTLLCGPCTICCIAPGKRDLLIKNFGLAPDGMCSSSCMAWVCCPTCTNCQEARELKSRNVTTNDEFVGAGVAAGDSAA